MIRRIDSKGVIAVVAAIALPVLLLLASGALDLGRAYIIKQRLQTAVDSAALVAQVNAAQATPETACQSVDTMNAALTANITSNGFLSTSTPTLVSCHYDDTTKKIVVTATININKTIGFAPPSVTATGYADLENTNTNASEWIALYCYGSTAITSSSQCVGYANLSVDQSSSSGTTVSVTGPVCQSSIKNNSLGSDCESFNNKDSQFLINTNANLSGSTVDTSGNTCSQCNKAYFDSAGSINYGTTVVTDLYLYFSSPTFQLKSGTALTVGQNGHFCDNGINANGATINVINGGVLGCQGYQDPHIDINGNAPGLIVSGGSSLYERYININNSSASISDSTVTLSQGGNSFTLNSSSASVINSTFNIGSPLVLNSATLDLNNTQSSLSYIQSNNAKFIVEKGSKVTVPNATSNINSTEMDFSGASTFNLNNYTVINSSSISVDGANTVTNFNGDTSINNLAVTATNGGAFSLSSNNQGISGLTLNASGKSTIVINNVNAYQINNAIGGVVNGTGSSIVINLLDHSAGSLQTAQNKIAIAVQNGGTLTVH
ncbi:MAG: pilus assembly protein TadG-related protein [Acetobacter sp.]